MSNEMLNENIQNLFRDLLLQEDIDGERKLLQESGINIDEESLEEFHKKKEEVFAFAKENKTELRLLTSKEVESVSGGIVLSKILTLKNIINALVRGFWAGIVRGKDGFSAGIDSLAIGIFTNVACEALDFILSKPNGNVNDKKS